MIKRKYYCIIAGFPDLFFNENKPCFGSLDFRNELEYQLDKPDFELVKLVFLPFDNENLLNLLFRQNIPFIQKGNLPKYFLEPDLEQAIELPLYMIQFIKWVKNQESRVLNLQIENVLYRLFYEFLLKVKNYFLREWFTFELNIKNILSAINCRHFNYTPEFQLINAGSESTVYSLLQNNILKPELFEEEVPFSEQIFRIAESESSALEKEKAIDKIKWDYLDDNTFFHYFTIEKILSFVIKLNITERWLKLDAKTGKELLNKLIDELKTSYKFPAEFSIAK
jgi:hypothetical protein